MRRDELIVGRVYILKKSNSEYTDHYVGKHFIIGTRVDPDQFRDYPANLATCLENGMVFDGYLNDRGLVWEELPDARVVVES